MSRPLAPGDRVKFAATKGGARVIDGYVDEVRERRGKGGKPPTRVIWVKDDEGNVYRRAPEDVEGAAK